MHALILAIVPLLPFSHISYEPAGSWCWVTKTPEYARFILFYCYVWIFSVAICINYVRVWWFVRSPPIVIIANPEKNKNWQRLFRQLFLFPAAFVILWTPATINRIVQAAHHPTFATSFLEALFVPLQGFVNAIIYGITSNVLQVPKEKEQSVRLLQEEPYLSTDHV